MQRGIDAPTVGSDMCLDVRIIGGDPRRELR
jgi:hypothetical protein